MRMVILKSKETYIYINIIKTKIQNKGNDLINTLTSIIKNIYIFYFFF